LPDARKPPANSQQPPSCDHCGSADLTWVKCKLICRSCRQIAMSCADL
jgi:hypothetical protein